MKSTLEYLEEAKNAKSIKSDNAFGLSIGITRAAMSSYKTKKSTMDDYTCIQIAGILKINPMEVIAAANYEREKAGDKKEFWLNFMMQYARSTAAGAVLLIGISGSFLTYSEPAKAENNDDGITASYYYQKFCKALSRWFKNLRKTENPLLAGFFTSALLGVGGFLILIACGNYQQEKPVL